MSFAESIRGEPHGGGFATTHWSVIVAASQPDSVAQDEALATLCRSYWPPVYAYIRRRGHKPEDAQDLTQEFFARLLAKEWLAGIEPQVGRFRSFLLTAVSRFLANEYDRSTAAKRGAGVLPLDLEHAETVSRHPRTAPESPGRTYAVEGRPDLSVEEWVIVPGTKRASAGASYEVSLPFRASQPQEFYRIRQLP